ncbi:Fe-S-cluster-containing hydrogenase components 2 [Longilinea arvoryzae]|uniref:Fe-S-cluster-containing hydrogenase components 2 n=1 Tax=Longilinea arvoryzae TaxID=360412 RepID=A0A0S7BG20_9CHLR|nr:4Fe-4S dicluster domain-containing protein [Longilinea arvoryzae]GAP13972.1 Fe-S-cluster-containing hydrogenase components 2 [Longilinea arvoryzae]
MIFSIKPDNCTGCLACVVYCSLAHEGGVNPELSRIRVYQTESRQTILPVVCLPCDEKPCIQACPQGAISLHACGAVIIDESLCTGCSRCVRACGIGAIHFHRLSGRGKNGVAVSLKCDQCGGDPWCIRVCPNGAIEAVESSAAAAATFEQIRSALEPFRAVKKSERSERQPA